MSTWSTVNGFFLIIYDGAPHLKKGLVIGNRQTYDLILGKDLTGDPLCRYKDGSIIYLHNSSILLENMVPFDINPKNNMQIGISDRAFWALKVFALKSKLFAMSDAAYKTHGEVQRDMWYKVIGLLEPIFAGGWM